jgi:hypothetical protein
MKISRVLSVTAATIASISTTRSVSGAVTGVAPAASAEMRYIPNPCSG